MEKPPTDRDRIRDLRVFWQRFSQNKLAVAGGAILVGWAGLGFIFPLVTSASPYTINLSNVLQSPGLATLLGTDELGRNVLTRIIYGARLEFEVALLTVLIGGSIGTAIGLISGYCGGVIDHVLVVVQDVLLSFPGILLALAIVSVLGPGTQSAIIAVGIATIPTFSRLVRGVVLQLKEMPFVEAAKAIGESSWSIVTRYIIPNSMPPIIVQTTYRMAVSILTVASLSFLGLGVPIPQPEWGVMVNTGEGYLATDPYLCIIPGVALASMILAWNFVGDGLRDVLDPRTYIRT